MNCFQFICKVLDELYDQILLVHGNSTDQIIARELPDLSNKLRALKYRNDVDYSNPVTRFAYIYCYTTAHADIVYQFINNSPELYNLFKVDAVDVSCIGGGPGSDFLGILKYIALQAPRNLKRLQCLLCDKEQSWRESWWNVNGELSSSSFQLFTTFWELDVTDTSRLTPRSNIFHADLFTMIYFLSELYFGIEDTRDFFEIMVASAKPGALFLFVDDNDRDFYRWFDDIAINGGLQTVRKEENYRFVVGWDEQADDLAKYNAKFGRNPKLQTSIAYRIYQKG